jgi:hypothetical protein
VWRFVGERGAARRLGKAVSGRVLPGRGSERKEEATEDATDGGGFWNARSTSQSSTGTA